MRTVRSAPFCIRAGWGRGSFQWFAPKMKRGSLWQSWKQIPHHSSPSRAWPHAAPSLAPAVGWCSAGLQRPPRHPTGLWVGARVPAARVAPAAAGPAATNERGLRSTSRGGGSAAAVLGTAGCPRSSVTSPPLAVLGRCSPSEAARKTASSTAAPFSIASPLLTARVTNVTRQVTQSANISG